MLSAMLTPIDVAARCAQLAEPWSPKVIAQVNDQYVKVARLAGTFVWHEHADEDELFVVVRGRLRMELEDGVVELRAGECLVVPRGVRHRPVADEECWVMLVEPTSTRHTGDTVTPLTRSIAEQLG